MVHKTLHISSMLHDDMDTLFFGCVCSAHSKGVWDINFYEKNKPKNHYFSVCACSFKNKSFEFFFNLGKQQLLYNFGNLEIMNSNNVISVCTRLLELHLW